MIDCASITRHNQHNFPVFPPKKYCYHNLHFWLVLQHIIVICSSSNQFFGPEISVVCLLSHSWDLGSTRSDLGPFHRTQRMRIARLPIMESVCFLYLSENELCTLKISGCH